MSIFRELIDAILRVMFGHNAVDNVVDLKKAHDKTRSSQAEVEQIIRESERLQ